MQRCGVCAGCVQVAGCRKSVVRARHGCSAESAIRLIGARTSFLASRSHLPHPLENSPHKSADSTTLPAIVVGIPMEVVVGVDEELFL